MLLHMRITRRTRLLAPALVAIAPLYTLAPVSAAPAKPRVTCVTVSPVAHRGGTERYVEDTADAFRSSPVGFWENDVRFTSDDVPIIMHDATVDRTTNGTGVVADLPWSYVSTLRTDDDQAVMTLREFINDQSVDRVYAFVEPKGTMTEAQWAVFVAAIKSREGWGGPRPAISSFDPDVLDEVAVRLPGYTRALVQSVGDADPADITPHATILLKHHDAITAGRLANWTGAGLRVYAWADPAADPVSEWARISSYSNDLTPGSVSGYITGKPQAYLDWRAGFVC
jgi:glycerophosphoryl diester phosphodiesterase